MWCLDAAILQMRRQMLLEAREEYAGSHVMSLPAAPADFVTCSQCLILTYPHSACICAQCGIRHPHHLGCRRMLACRQCGETVVAHTICHCLRCGRRHQNNRGCRVRSEPVVFAAALMRNNDVQPHSISNCDIECGHCGARTWPGETLSCCERGALVLHHFPTAPPELADLIYCSHVQQHIRKYNSALSMASVGHKSKGLNWGAFVLGGRTYHRIGSVLPDVGSPHCFAQIYILDVSAATDRRLGVFGGADSLLRREVLAQLHERLSDHNPLIQQFVAVARGDVPHVVWKCSDDISTMQLGALVADAGSRRDIVVQRPHGPVMCIHDGHGLYHPLAYPLLFPMGTAGWNEDMVVANPEGHIPIRALLFRYLTLCCSNIRTSFELD